METQKIILDNLGLNQSNTKDLAQKWIQDSIQMIKLQRLSDWEGNHQANLNSSDAKIQELLEIQETLEHQFDAAQPNEKAVGISFQIEVKQVRLKKAV